MGGGDAGGAKPLPEGLLDGWKQIAEYLGRTERTVQRWEKNKGLPIRRLQADSPEEQPRVFAYKSELDLWWKEHQTKLNWSRRRLRLRLLQVLKDWRSMRFPRSWASR